MAVRCVGLISLSTCERQQQVQGLHTHCRKAGRRHAPDLDLDLLLTFSFSIFTIFRCVYIVVGLVSILRHVGFSAPAAAHQFAQWAVLSDWLHSSVGLSGLNQFLHKPIDLVASDIGHNNNVGNILLASQLPSLNESVVHGPLQNDSAAKVVQSASEAGIVQHLAKVPSGIDAVRHIALDAGNTLLPKRVPKVERRLTVAAAHDGGINAIEIIDPLLHLLHVLLARKGDSTRHGTSQHLVSADGNAINGLTKRHLRSKVHEGHHHGEEGTVAVNVESIAGNTKLGKDAKDSVQIVHSTLHGGANVDINDHGFVEVLLNLRGQGIVINLSGGQCLDGPRFHPIVSGSLEDRVMRLLAGVKDAIGVTFAREEDAMEVTLRSAGGDVSPVLVRFHLPKAGKEINNTALELSRMDTIVGGDVGISEVVDRVLHELVPKKFCSHII